jgi:CHASE2 domain-containing sensor protein
MNALTIFGNVMWISALAVLVATSGWYVWRARLHQVKLYAPFNSLAVSISLFLFCLGVFLATHQPWARFVFSLLAFFMVWIAIVNKNSSIRGNQ